MWCVVMLPMCEERYQQGSKDAQETQSACNIQKERVLGHVEARELEVGEEVMATTWSADTLH